MDPTTHPGVFCDPHVPCKVHTSGFKLEICLPDSGLGDARVCEAYGEPWQQVGVIFLGSGSGLGLG